MAGSPWGLEGKSGRWLREGRVQPSEKQMEGAWLWREAATGFLCAHQILGSTPGVTRGSASPSGGRSSLEMSGLSSTGVGGEAPYRDGHARRGPAAGTRAVAYCMSRKGMSGEGHLVQRLDHEWTPGAAPGASVLWLPCVEWPAERSRRHLGPRLGGWRGAPRQVRKSHLQSPEGGSPWDRLVSPGSHSCDLGRVRLPLPLLL